MRAGRRSRRLFSDVEGMRSTPRKYSNLNSVDEGGAAKADP